MVYVILDAISALNLTRPWDVMSLLYDVSLKHYTRRPSIYRKANVVYLVTLNAACLEGHEECRATVAMPLIISTSAFGTMALQNNTNDTYMD